MSFCDVVPDLTNLETNRFNLRSITTTGDRFKPMQMSLNVSLINLSFNIISLNASSL